MIMMMRMMVMMMTVMMKTMVMVMAMAMLMLMMKARMRMSPQTRPFATDHDMLKTSDAHARAVTTSMFAVLGQSIHA